MKLASLTAAAVLALLAIEAANGNEPPTPKSVEDLWSGFVELDQGTPLEAEVLKAWEQDGVSCRIVRYQVGIFKGAPSRVAAFYAYPTGQTNLPAILEMHGGGQSASLDSVVTYAKRGYAAMSINWGGNKMSLGAELWTGPQTDWGKLDATHPPQRNTANHFAGSLAPDDYTLDSVESPRNSNWFLVLMAARRAITFLEQQPEVDAARIGALGHSMGGKLTTNLAGIDKRIKAAVPSCGGSGDLVISEAAHPGGSRTKRTAMELACISDNAYIPLITCPILWLSPTNDFHAHIDNMAWNWRELPDDQVRFSISPHLNHRHTPEHSLTEYLWLEEHLKGAEFRMPATPKLVIDLESPDGVPRVVVTPDASAPVKRVDIYYSIDPHALTRFWRDAEAMQDGHPWKSVCPIMDLDQPIFAFANVVYETPEQYRSGPWKAGQESSDTFAVSSRVLAVGPQQLKAANIKVTDKPARLIDDGNRGWHDWYQLNWNHAPLWTVATRKLKDVKWRGPDGASLCFEVQCPSDNQLVLTFNCNAWGAFTPGAPALDYAVVKELKGSPDWQTVSVKLDELLATDPNVTSPLTDWQTVTEFSISPSGMISRNGMKTKIDGTPWQGPREIRNLRWEGGDYGGREKFDKALDPSDFDEQFNNAIKKSNALPL